MQELNLQKYNRHWEPGFRYPYPKKRDLFENLIKYLPKKQIIEIIGLRRTGKTVLLFQVLNDLLDKKINPFSLWYFTFDEEGGANLEELLSSFVKQTGKSFKKEKTYLFLDEIQKLKNFQNQLKIYYDLYPNLKIFISGSTSLFVKKKTQESLAGRIFNFILPPLSFKEYLSFKEKKHLLENPVAWASDIEQEFEMFWQTQFVESIGIKDKKDRKDYFISLMKKIVFEDVPQVFPVDNPEILWRIVQIIGHQPGMLFNYQGISQELGISSKTLSAYLYYLEESFLVKKLYNFSRNLLTSEKKLKKVYLTSPSFSWAVTDFAQNGKLAENAVLSVKNYQFFWRDVYKHEVDFVDTADNKIVPIEVKYKKEATRKELKNLALFVKSFDSQEGILLKKGLEKTKTKINGLQILQTPIYLY